MEVAENKEPAKGKNFEIDTSGTLELDPVEPRSVLYLGVKFNEQWGKNSPQGNENDNEVEFIDPDDFYKSSRPEICDNKE